MPALKNTRHEAFAQALATGEPASRAYEIAGYKPNDGNAARLKGNDKVLARVEEIVGKAAEKAGITATRVLKELGHLGFANMQDYVTLDEHGQPHVDLTKLPRERWAAVKKITVEQLRRSCAAGEVEGEDGDDVPSVSIERVTFELHDKRHALVAIGKHLGMFADKAAGLPANAPPGTEQPQKPPEEELAELSARFRGGGALRVIEGGAAPRKANGAG